MPSTRPLRMASSVSNSAIRRFSSSSVTSVTRLRQTLSRVAASYRGIAGCRGSCRWGTGDAAVGLHQVGQRLLGPVGGLDVRELGDAGDLISGIRVIRNAVEVQLGGISPGSQKARAATDTSSCWKSLILDFLQRKKAKLRFLQSESANLYTIPSCDRLHN